MRKRVVLLALVPFLLAATGPAPAAEVKSSSYKGWKSLALDNGLVRLEVVPEIGGRIMQLRLGTNEFFFVNAQLAGKLPPPERLGPGGTWLNYGADKLWPAPQGKGNPDVWPGPPDVVLDAGPYELTVREDSGRAAAIHLLSGKDMRSGIRFSRLVRVEDGSTHVGFDATMTNIDTKPRRWGIWSHTQLDGGKPDGKTPNPLMRAWCPINPESRFPDGYRLMFGPRANPSFQPHALPGLMRVDYLYRVGKIGMDSRAGWVATVNGATGAVFVQRFVFEPEKEYPDGASVEFWHNGTGRIVQPGGKERVYPDDPAENPFVFESEILSPFARLEPGESYTWHYDWYAGNIGGDFPVLDCTDAGIVSEPLAVTEADGRFRLRGRFGVFAPGTLQAVVRDSTGATLKTIDLKLAVGPLKPVLLEAKIESDSGAASVAVVLVDRAGKNLGLLAAAEIPLLPCPTRGTLGLRPAGRWEESLVTGNGKMSALVPGGTDREAIILSHEKLFLPWEKPIPPPDTAGRLKEIRALLAAGKFQEAADVVVEQSKKEGYGAKRWTDPFIPAFDLVLETDTAGETRRYSRSLDLMTGVADTAWETRAGRSAFRPDGTSFSSSG